ncbi:MAG: methyltransferase [Bacteroidota bacterium]|nr:methyltransferase [Bacteroidota bacterium]
MLLGAIASNDHAERILDIGTGTGVIALMLAQRFTDAQIDAVEIDLSAATTAAKNFKNSAFKERLNIFRESIEEFFNEYPDNTYDLIITNPPFYLNSLESPKEKKTLAKHTDADFFEGLMKGIAAHLSPEGLCWLVLPAQTAALIKDLAKQNRLCQHKIIEVRSFEHSEPHRNIVCFGFDEVVLTETASFTIYEAASVYSDQYKALLYPFFLNL